MTQPIIIVGSGLAGYEFAKEFRKLDQTTPLLIITSNQGNYYSKPLLSTALTQDKNADMLIVADANTMAMRLNATILTETLVTKINTSEQCIYYNHKMINYSYLVLACGAKPIPPIILGDAKEILSVNHWEEYALFRDLIRDKKHITILGAGLVGCEFANDLLNQAYQVTLVAPARYPLDKLVPEAIGLSLQNALQEKGAQWYLNHLASEIKRLQDGYYLSLTGRRGIKTDIVLSAIGIQPQTTLAGSAGIKINRGIIVDDYLETSAKNVFALGDCAEIQGVVLPYVAPLLHGARVLAKTLAGNRTAVAYPHMPIVIKTASCPVVVLPPPRNVQGEWYITGEGKNLKALFQNKQGELLGFALTGDRVKEKMVLIKQLTELVI